MLFSADDDLLVRAADLDHVERRAGGYAESLALADREIVNASVLTDDVAVGGDEVASGVRQGLALLGEVGVDEALVVATGDKANLLRVGLFREGETVLAREFAHLGLGHVTERKDCPTELLLRQAEEKISLILTVVGGALEQPTVTSLVKSHASIVSSGDALGSDLLGDDEQLIKLQVVVAQA